MPDEIDRIWAARREIERRCKRLGVEITEDRRGLAKRAFKTRPVSPQAYALIQAAAKSHGRRWRERFSADALYARGLDRNGMPRKEES